MASASPPSTKCEGAAAASGALEIVPPAKKDNDGDYYL